MSPKLPKIPDNWKYPQETGTSSPDFWNPPAVSGPPRPLPPEYVPEDGYSAFLRAAANRATFNTADGLAAMGDATIPLNTGASRAPNWAQRAQENRDAQYRTSIADQYYHPITTLIGQGFGILIDPLAVFGPRPASLPEAVARGAATQTVRKFGSNERMRQEDKSDGLDAASIWGGVIGALGHLIRGGR